MKNNRLTNDELRRLRATAEEIKRLCTLETASFSIDETEDKRIKQAIKPWLIWFDIEANTINRIIEDV
jgi:DTW domain-containing protein YfiP